MEPRQNPSHPVAIASTMLLTFLSSLTPVFAQARHDFDPPTLSTQVLRRPSIGLSFTLPVGARSSSFELGSSGPVRIIFNRDIAVTNATTATLDTPLTLAQLADKIIEQRLGSVSSITADPDLPTSPGAAPLVNTQGALIHHSTPTINNHPAVVFYIQTRALSGPDHVFGYALFAPTPDRVATFELITSQPVFAEARAHFELLVNTVRFTDPSLADAQRALGLEACNAFTQSLTEDDYHAILTPGDDEWAWERLYRPAPTGSDDDAIEIGYRRTRISRGTRNELRAGKPPVTPIDRQQGYIVRQEYRILDSELVYDVSAAFFVSLDRQDEAWTVRQAVKPAKPTGNASLNDVAQLTIETGVRSASDMTVAITGADGSPVAEIKPVIDGPGYLSRAEVVMLPSLVLHKQAAGDFRAYAYNSAAQRITLRQDTFERAADTNALTHTSRNAEDAQPQTSTFNAKGDLLTTSLPDGRTWEPTTLNTLLRLWKAKGLPLD